MSNDHARLEPYIGEIQDKPDPLISQERIENISNDWFTVLEHSSSVKVIKWLP